MKRILILAVVLALAGCQSVGWQPSDNLASGSILHARGLSNSPEIRDGATWIFRRGNYEDIYEGAMVVRYLKTDSFSGYIMHRAERKTSQGLWLTKGLANKAFDWPPMTRDSFLGFADPLLP